MQVSPYTRREHAVVSRLLQLGLVDELRVLPRQEFRTRLRDRLLAEAEAQPRPLQAAGLS